MPTQRRSALVRPLWTATAGLGCALALASTSSAKPQCPLGLSAKVVPAEIVEENHFGTSVAIDGDLAIVGAERDDDGGTWSGSAFVLERDALGWSVAAKLEPGPGDFQLFGADVGVSGDTLVVGANGGGAGGGAGIAYLYERQSPGWALAKTFDAPQGSLDFGATLAIDGDTLVIGSRRANDNGFNSGAVDVYGRDQGGPGTWGAIARPVAPDGAPFDFFGDSVALHGETLVVGASGRDETGVNQGALYVYERDFGGPDTWGFVTKLLGPDGAASDSLGEAVTIHGDTIIGGAYRAQDANGTEVGAAYVFERNVGGPNAFGFTQKLVSPTGAPDEGFGVGVAVHGDRALIGTFFPTQVAYVHERDAGGLEAWGSTSKVEPHDKDTFGYGAWFGTAVALDADRAIVAAQLDSQNGVGGGAAYLYEDGLSTSTIHCTAKMSSSGCQPRISTTGSASASAPTGFVIDAGEVEARRVGLLTYGTSGSATIPFGGGLLCPAPPVRFVGLQVSGGQVACSGTLAFDFNAHVASGTDPNLVAGADVDAQFWYRDPADASGLGLTDAAGFSVCP